MQIELLQSLFSQNELHLPGELLTVKDEYGKQYVKQGFARAVVKTAAQKPTVSQPSVPSAQDQHEA